jgi:Ran GTPase-activating protein (RanGAP) involved in mRNA processing and transport
LRFVAKTFFSQQTLSLLDLESNDIGDVGIQHLADVLRHHPVDFYFTVTESVIRILRFLSISKALAELFLRNNSITATGADHLAEALRSNTVSLFSADKISFESSLDQGIVVFESSP